MSSHKQSGAVDLRQGPGKVRTLVLAGLAGAIAAAMAGGCQTPLFSPIEDRTQFDRYDKVRNQYEPQYVEDEFGRREPNLRGRLAPKS